MDRNEDVLLEEKDRKVKRMYRADGSDLCYLNNAEAVALTGLSIKTLCNWYSLGYVKKRRHGRYVWDRESLESYMLDGKPRGVAASERHKRRA